jgi:hypothetical protein
MKRAKPGKKEKKDAALKGRLYANIKQRKKRGANYGAALLPSAGSGQAG